MQEIHAEYRMNRRIEARHLERFPFKGLSVFHRLWVTSLAFTSSDIFVRLHLSVMPTTLQRWIGLPATCLLFVECKQV